MDSRRAFYFILAVALAAFVLQAAYLFSASLDRLTAISIVDDAFYYLGIARHVARDGLCSFDGLHRTNGFQPLWQALTLPLGLIESRELAVRLLGLLGAFVYQATTILLYLYLDKRCSRRAALLAALLWALNTRLLFTYAVSGMEFALYALTVLAVLLAYDRYRERPTASAAAVLGALAGVCLLARLDGVILAFICAGAITWSGWAGRRTPAALRHLFCFTAAAVLVTLPWYLWNGLTFGRLFPISGAIKLNETRRLLAGQWHAPFGGPRHVALAIGQFAYYLAIYLMRFATGYFYYLFRLFGWGQSVIGVMGLALLGLVAAAGLRRGVGRLAGQLRPFALLIFFVLAQFAAYAFFLFPYLHYGNWYFGPFYLVCAIVAALLWDEGPGRAGERWAGAAAALLLLLNTTAFLVFHDETKINVMGGKECLAYLDAHYQSRRIGAWNAGYLGYFSTRNTVVNLDGLVNDDELARLIFTGVPLGGYLAANRIDLLCDYQGDPAAIRDGFYGFRPAQYRVLFASRYYQPVYIDPRIYYVLELKPDAPAPGGPATQNSAG